MKARMASFSPSKKRTWPGMSFSVVNMKVKYHSGLMPSGVAAKGSAFFPTSQGRKTQMTPMRTRMSVQPRASL